MAGWVKVDRSIQEHWLWSEKPFSKAQAWIDLILYANHKEAKIMIKHRLIEIKRGQQARSEVTLSKEWGWSRDKVRRFLKLLESDGMVIQQKTNVTTLLTICNYDGFQSTATPDNTADDTAGNTPDDTPAIQQSIHKQECNKEKKVKNEKKLDKPWVSPAGLNLEAWAEFEQHRKDIKKPMSDLARTKAANQIIALSKEDQQLTIDKSIAARWPGLYPDKITASSQDEKRRAAIEQGANDWANGIETNQQVGDIFENGQF